jgi:hypothetical protein
MIQPATLSQMLTIDQFVTIVPLPLRLTVMSRRSQQSLTILTLVARGLFRLASSPTQEARVAADTGGVHTPTMTLKTAALLTLIGTVLMTALLVWNFVFNLLNLLRGLVPALTVLSSSIYAFGCFSVMVFFFVFHRTQS